MGGAIVVFAIVVSIYLDRTQRQLVAQNKDLTRDPRRELGRPRRHVAAGSARAVARPAADRDRCAGRDRGRPRADDGTCRVRRPADARAGSRPGWAPSWPSRRPALAAPALRRRTGDRHRVLDLPSIRGDEPHRPPAARVPPARSSPTSRDEALIDIAGEIAGAAQLGARPSPTSIAASASAPPCTRSPSSSPAGPTSRRPRHDHRPRPGAARGRACRRLPVGCHAIPRTARPRRATGSRWPTTAACAWWPTRRAPTVHARNPLLPAVMSDGQVRRGPPARCAAPTACWASCAWSAPSAPVQRRRARPAGRPRRHGRDRRPHGAPPRGGGAVDHPSPSGTGSPASSTTAWPRCWARSTSSCGRSRAGRRTRRARRSRDELSELAETADEAYRDVREAILGLRETVREDGGLEGSLREYLRKYSRQTGIATVARPARATRAASLSPRSEVQLLRVVQEALTNTRKHSGATARDRPHRLLGGGTTADDRGRRRRLRPGHRDRLDGGRLRAGLDAGAGRADRRHARRAYCAEARGRRSSSASSAEDIAWDTTLRKLRSAARR